MSQPPINVSLAASASSTGAISGNMSRIFGDIVIGKKALPWWAWLIAFGVLLLFGVLFFLWALTRGK
jgi:hypothetical protein